MEPSRHTSVVRFGTYEIALHSGELRKAGVRIRVQQQPLKLLEILLEHPGEVVTREELRSRIWPNEDFGDFDQAVNVAIAKAAPNRLPWQHAWKILGLALVLLILTVWIFRWRSRSP